MTTKIQTTIIALLTIALAVSMTPVFASEYGYQASRAGGGEITDIRGDSFTYLNRLDSNSKHVDTLAYITNTGTFSAGVGYYDKQVSGTETYQWLKYWDEGATDNNEHWVTVGGPTSETWKGFDIWEVDSDTYDFSIGSQGFNSMDCVSTCPNPTISGVVVYSSAGSDPDDNVKGYFKDLEVDSGSGWESWDDASDDYKCNNDSSDFDLVTNSNIDDVIFDIGSVDECASNSSVWLFNGGSGG